MNSTNFQTFFDCGFSKIRAGTFSTNNKDEAFYADSGFFVNQSNLELKIQKIIDSLEKNSKEYIKSIGLMLDSPKILSVGISLSKKLDGTELKKTNIQFLVQEAKQQISQYYVNYNITHIIINNYKIDGINYSYLPDKIKCDFISVDILFICLPTDLVIYFKDIFSRSNILVNQIICSSYAKSINYKEILSLSGYVSFIDIGFQKTSITSYFDDEILSLDVFPVGSNHITKDISKILKIDFDRSEKIKRNFIQEQKLLNKADISTNILQKVIYSRIEEILNICMQFIKLNLITTNRYKIILAGEGSKIFNNELKNKILNDCDMDILEETTKEVCEGGLILSKRLNKQEVIEVPRKSIKQGFFEKFFHFFN